MVDSEEYLRVKRAENDRSNREEFVKAEEGGSFSSRTSARYVDPEVHIRTAVIDQQDKLLSRTIAAGPEIPEVVDPAEERIRNIEGHLGIMALAARRNLFARIKAIEDKILRIEQNYPQIAAHCFNYGRVEAEASKRPGGRVSKAEPKKKQGKAEKEEEQAVASSLKDMQAKMLVLKTKLVKK